jgi:hypothetical protein
MATLKAVIAMDQLQLETMRNPTPTAKLPGKMVLHLVPDQDRKDPETKTEAVATLLKADRISPRRKYPNSKQAKEVFPLSPTPLSFIVQRINTTTQNSRRRIGRLAHSRGMKTQPRTIPNLTAIRIHPHPQPPQQQAPQPPPQIPIL